MTRLLCERLTGSNVLKQRIKATHNLEIAACYLNVYRTATEASKIKVEIRDSLNRTLAVSNSVFVNSFTGPNAQFIGFLRFDIAFMFRSNAEYDLCFLYDPAFPSTIDPMHWNRDFDHLNNDLRAVNIMYSGGRGYDSPFYFKMIERTNVRKGGYHVT